MAREFTLIKIKCIAPSGGLGSAVEWAAIGAGAVVGGVASAAATTATGGALVGTVGVATLGGASAGQWAATTTDTVFKGGDDLYVTVNGSKVWPENAKHQYIESQNEKQVNHTIGFTGDVQISFWEHDSFSKDDHLGTLTIPTSLSDGGYVYRVESDHKSCYEAVFTLKNVS